MAEAPKSALPPTTPPPPTSQTPKQEPPPTNEHINLRVCAPDGGEVYFKIKRTTSFKKLMDAYCQRQSINPASIRFLYDGQRLKEDQNPGILNMEDRDVIDAVIQQTGGYLFAQ